MLLMSVKSMILIRLWIILCNLQLVTWTRSYYLPTDSWFICFNLFFMPSAVLQVLHQNLSSSQPTQVRQQVLLYCIQCTAYMYIVPPANYLCWYQCINYFGVEKGTLSVVTWRKIQCNERKTPGVRSFLLCSHTLSPQEKKRAGIILNIF